jgi:hypothetical protein
MADAFGGNSEIGGRRRCHSSNEFSNLVNRSWVQNCSCLQVLDETPITRNRYSRPEMEPVLLKKLQNIGVRSFNRRRGQLLHTSSLQQCRTTTTTQNEVLVSTTTTTTTTTTQNEVLVSTTTTTTTTTKEVLVVFYGRWWWRRF